MNPQRAIAYFVSLGWTPAQAAGIVANLFAESHLNPQAVGDGGQAYGIAQWHADRQAHFASVMGKDIHGSTVEEQLAFVHAELIGSEMAAGDALRLCATASEAGECVSERYERPADVHGEATRRGALAAKFAGEQPAEAPPEITAAQPGANMGAIAIPLLTQLLPQVLSLFSNRAQAQIAKATGADPATAGAFMQSLITQIGQQVGVPVTDAASATQAVAEVTKQPPEQQAATVATLEQYSLDQLAPMLDKVHGYETDAWQAENAGKQTVSSLAIEEHKAGLWDMTKWIVVSLLLMLWGIAWGLLGSIIYLAASAKPDANPAMLTALVGLAGPIWTGAIVASVVAIVSYRFDGSKESTAATAAVAQIAKGKNG